jgi:phosphoribosylformylglycinamidine synthase
VTRVLVLRSPGTNCDQETARAFELAGAEAERVHVGEFLRRERRLDEFHILAFPGGFSYGDDLGAGTVLANRMRARLADDLRAFVAGGRLAIGICNGFQILVRLGLLPGWEGEKAASLIENASGKFEDRWVSLRVETPRSPFLGARGPGLIRLPVAHREGRFVLRDREALERLRSGGQVALRYADLGAGEPRPAERYPLNPNGSTDAIAGISNPAGNVLGLMPHPERHVRALQDPQWTRRAAAEGLPAGEEQAGDGFRFFASAVEHARRG